MPGGPAKAEAGDPMRQDIPIPIAVSARHVHLSAQTLESLFGAGYRLRARSELSQPGQFAAQETVTLVGPRGRLEHVRIIGPPRPQDQIELSRSDEIALGLDAPVRVSGDLAATPGIRIIGPLGEVALEHGVITPARHIHMSPVEAARLHVSDRQRLSVAIDSDGRDLVFGDVIARVSPDYRLELHLDTDEANAAGVRHGDTARIVRITLEEGSESARAAHPR
jgi:propanediol utilization protein